MAEKIKKFYRARKDRVLFGVCGGLGKYFSIDPILFRLLFILLFLMNGVGFLLYVIMVFITPEEPGRTDAGENGLKGEVDELTERIDKKAKEISNEMVAEDKKISDSRNLLGGIIIVFGLFFLARQFFPMLWIDTNVVWALAIIGIGLYIIFKK